MTINLSNLKCEPCTGKTKKMTPDEISTYLSQINDWAVNKEQEMIFKKFTFKNFKETMKFTNIIAEIAESEGHHPNISIGWGYSIVMIHTHAIKGLSVNDFVLASKIDKIDIKNL